MHVNEPNPKKRLQTLIVLGLTGPVGSGCSYVSRFFYDPDNPNRRQGNELLKYLIRNSWVHSGRKGSLGSRWGNINRVVDRLHRRIASDGGNEREVDRNETVRKGSNKLSMELINTLEFREALKAFERLRPYYKSDKHLFRTLSVSDLIVFHVLKSIEENKKSNEKYKKFIDIAKKRLCSPEVKQFLKEAEVDNYKEYYKKCKNSQNEEELKKLSRGVYKIHNHAKDIKREFFRKYPDLYTEVMQDFGDNLRRSGNPFSNRDNKEYKIRSSLAEDVADIIDLLYKTEQGAFFVIDCLRNPYEIIYLRRKFANFYLLSVFAEKELRKRRICEENEKLLKDKYVKENVITRFEEADTRDSGKEIKKCAEALYRQNVTKCVQISDVAINNSIVEEENNDELLKKILRSVCLIVSPGCSKPNDDEMFMNLAYTMAVKSNCICRQVGAVIIGSEGYLVGAGWNDAGEGRISCGLRAIRDLSRDKEFEELADVLRKKLQKDTIEGVMEDLARYRDRINKRVDTRQFCFCVKDNVSKEHQLQYCLALHAEENAIIQSSKIGGMGLKEGTIYSTSQPCTLCGKMIQQVGLKKVVYTEAYPASLSDVYMKVVDLEQFEGVKPRSYIKLFMPHHDQKEWQKLERNDLVPQYA